MRDDQRRRFARHIALPEIGLDGQEALLDAAANIDGTDEAARLAATYLVAGGAGHTHDTNLAASTTYALHLPIRPDWWPGDDGTALAFWRAGTAAADWMIDVVRHARVRAKLREP